MFLAAAYRRGTCRSSTRSPRRRALLLVGVGVVVFGERLAWTGWLGVACLVAGSWPSSGRGGLSAASRSPRVAARRSRSPLTGVTIALVLRSIGRARAGPATAVCRDPVADRRGRARWSVALRGAAARLRSGEPQSSVSRCRGGRRLHPVGVPAHPDRLSMAPLAAWRRSNRPRWSPRAGGPSASARPPGSGRCDPADRRQSGDRDRCGATGSAWLRRFKRRSAALRRSTPCSAACQVRCGPEQRPVAQRALTRATPPMIKGRSSSRFSVIGSPAMAPSAMPKIGRMWASMEVLVAPHRGAARSKIR